MKRQASITVTSHQYIDGDVQRQALSYEGTADISDTSVTLCYSDDMGDNIPTECKVEATQEKLVISRNGHTQTVLVIVPDKKHETRYRTVYGEFGLTVTGKKLSVKNSQDSTEITAYYYLDFASSGEVLNKVRITAYYGDIINE